MSEVTELIKAIAGLLAVAFPIYQWWRAQKGKNEAIKEKQEAVNEKHEAIKEAKEKQMLLEGEIEQHEPPAGAEQAHLQGLNSMDDMMRELKRWVHKDREGKLFYGNSWMIWQSPRGPIPVYVKRWGSRNHRCILPDNSMPLIPVDQLKPMYPCPDCNSSGKQECSACRGVNSAGCSTCGGSGTVTCPTCNGTGSYDGTESS